MGTDIHTIMQARGSNGQWYDVEHQYEEDRHYQLFAVLACVRNGYGFAGVKTGEAVVPISEPRGFPDDFEVHGECYHPFTSLNAIGSRRRKYVVEYPDDYEDGYDMGDHSHSWLLGSEILEWAEHAPKVVKTGILDRDVYERWDKKSAPDSWCGGISGAGVVIIHDNKIEKVETPNWTHIRCHWESDLAQELSYFFSEIQRLVMIHGEIRMVFGFDS